MEDVNNSGLIILLIIAVLFFVLWVIYFINYFCAKGKIKSKNRKIFSLVKGEDEKDNRIWEQEGTIRKQDEVIAGLKAELRAAAAAKIEVPAESGTPEEEDQTAPRQEKPSTPKDNWDEFSVMDPELEDRIMMHNLEDAILSSKLFLNQAATKEDVAGLIKVEKKRLDALLKNNGDITAMDLLGKYRLEEAIAKIREVKLDSKNKKKKEDESETPVKEVTLEDIAQSSGFPSVRAMNKASKQRYGMSINELRKVIKI